MQFWLKIMMMLMLLCIPNKAITVYFIRNGKEGTKSSDEAKGKLNFEANSEPYTNCDLPLSPKGKEQVKLWADGEFQKKAEIEPFVADIKNAITARKKFAYFSSPLRKAVQTLAIFTNNVIPPQTGQPERKLFVLPSLRETCKNEKDKSYVAGEDLNHEAHKGLTWEGSLKNSEARMDAILKSMTEVESGWNLKFVRQDYLDSNGHKKEYKQAVERPQEEYFQPFLDALFTKFETIPDIVLVSTHRRWISDFAVHVVDGKFGPRPTEDIWFLLTGEHKSWTSLGSQTIKQWMTNQFQKMKDAHIFRVDIQKEGDKYTFEDPEEEPPFGWDITDFSKGENEPQIKVPGNPRKPRKKLEVQSEVRESVKVASAAKSSHPRLNVRIFAFCVFGLGALLLYVGVGKNAQNDAIYQELVEVDAQEI